MASEAQKTAQGLRTFTLSFFALVGFIASVTTIVTYAKGTPQSALSVKIVPYQILIPKYVAGYLEDDSSTRKYAKSLMTELCKGIDSNKLIELSDDDLSSFSIKNVSAGAIRSCRDAHAVDFILRWNNKYSSSAGAYIYYSIENVGTDTAKGIRVSSNEVNAVQIKKGDKFFQIRSDKTQGYFQIPDLNPHEKAEVYVWLTNEGMINNREYPDTDAIPAVTYSGSYVKTEYFHPVGKVLWSIEWFFKGMPWPFVLFFVLVFSLLITGLVVLVISTATSIFKGHGLSGAFSSTSDKQNDIPSVDFAKPEASQT